MACCADRVPVLDTRLQTAAALVLPHLPCADVGCDHGKLTAYLLCSGQVPFVIASDLRPDPLAKAEQTLRRFGCLHQAELRLGDGLTVLHPGEVATVVIAGVSADTTIQLCEAAPWLLSPQGPRLVLVPATRHGVLRRWLLEKGFALREDVPVQAAGRWYAVMAAEWTGQAKTPTLREVMAGLTGNHTRGREYLVHELKKLQKVRIGLNDADPLAIEMDTLFRQEGLL